MQRDPHFEPEQPATIDIGQPDPALQQTEAGPLRKTIYAIGAIVILGVVFYGLTRPHPQNEINASRPAPSTTAQAPEQQTPAQDEATKGPGQRGQPGGQSGNATTGSAPQGDKPAQGGESKPQ